MPKHHCCAYNCTNSKEKKKDPVKYPEVANVTFHCFPQKKNDKIQYVPGMSEQERRRRWIAACRLESLNVTRHTRICSKHFEGGLGPAKANPVPTIFDFPENLQRKEVRPRQDPQGRRLKNASTTRKIQKASKRGNSKVRKCPDLVEQQEVHLENNASCTGEETVNQDLLLVTRELNLSESLIGDQQNVLEKSQPVELNVSRDKIKDNILLHDKAVQTDLSADQITRMEQAHFKLQDRRGELKENCLWRTCNETIPRSSFILAYLHFRVFSCYSIGSSMKYWDGKNKTRAETYQVKL